MKWVMLSIFVLAAFSAITGEPDNLIIRGNGGDVIRGTGGDIAMMEVINHGPPSAKYQWVPLPGCDAPPSVRLFGGMILAANCKRVSI